MADPYNILGVSRSASDDEVKKAYRDMCRKYHPDKNPGNTAAEEMFKVVQEAYDQIINERKQGGSAGGYYGSNSYGGASSGSYNSYGSYGQQTSGIDPHLQAAANYISSGHYQEALNVLNGMTDRGSQWYYLSSYANYAMGNTYAAQEQARTAASMEPGNIAYISWLNQLNNPGYSYSNFNGGYGSNMYNNDDFCTKLCLANLAFNMCCDCTPGCCC